MLTVQSIKKQTVIEHEWNEYTDTKDNTIIRQETHDLHTIHSFDMENHSFIYNFGISLLFKQGSNRNNLFYILIPFLIFDLEF